MRRSLLSMPTRRSTRRHKAASRQFLTWAALGERSPDAGPLPKINSVQSRRVTDAAHVDHISTEPVETSAVLSPNILSKRLTNTSVFVNVGMCCETPFPAESASVRMWVTALMPWQCRKRQIDI